MDKKINNNGFEYVDLELPSGTLWASCNVGAKKPSDYGLYFQWGDIQGYYEEQVGYDNEYKPFALDYSDYKWGIKPNYTKYTKKKKSNMNENLDLTKVLRDAPEGMKLWSPLYGDCIFMNIDLVDVIYPINCKVTTKDGRSTYIGFTKEGILDIQFENTGCVLFPSEENMDWSTFKVPKTHKEFELNQKVLVGLPFNNQYIWRRDIYLNYEKETKMHCTFYEKAVPDNLIIPYDKDKDGKQVPYENYH